jgi:membrane protein implicated in regulation of membrane protease activity
MIVMFILMVAPLLAIPAFWLLPIGQAIAVYLVALALSGWMFWLMRRNKKYRVVTGREGMIGREAEVISVFETDGKTTYTVFLEGELWTARSDNGVQPGDKVVVTAIEGSRPVIEPKNSGATGENLETQGGN